MDSHCAPGLMVENDACLYILHSWVLRTLESVHSPPSNKQKWFTPTVSVVNIIDNLLLMSLEYELGTIMAVLMMMDDSVIIMLFCVICFMLCF